MIPDAPWIRRAETDGMPEAEAPVCPICQAEEPEYFFVVKREVLGCSECIEMVDPWAYDGV